MSVRRELTAVLLLCVVGAAAVLVAVGQAWLVVVLDRPEPLSPLVSEQDGRELRPWLAALGWVALAGAGALLATRRWLRRLVGGLLVAAGAGAAVGAGTVVAGPVDGELQRGWPVLAMAGGLLVMVAGVVTGLRSPRWPAMGARYDRSVDRARDGDAGAGVDRRSAGNTAPEELWDALDRGDDPTAARSDDDPDQRIVPGEGRPAGGSE